MPTRRTTAGERRLMDREGALACVNETASLLARLDLLHAHALMEGDAKTRLRIIATAALAILNEARDFRQLDIWLWRFERFCRSEAPRAAAQLPPDLGCALLLAMTFRQPRHPRLRTWAKSLQQLLQDPAHIASHAGIAHSLIVYHIWSGNLRKALPLILHLEHLSEEEACIRRETPPFATLFLHIGRAVHAFLSGEDDTCLATCETGQKITARLEAHAWVAHLQGFAVASLLATGRENEARSRLDTMARDLLPMRHFDQALYHMLQTWHALEYGHDLSRARAFAKANQKISESLGATVPVFCALHQQVLLAIGEEDHDSARRYQQRARALAAYWRNPMAAFMCELADAWLALHAGETRELEHRLEKAFRIARCNGYHGNWCWHRDMMSTLCAEALTRGIEPLHGAAIVHRRKLAAPPSLDRRLHWPWPVKIYTLGRFGILVNEKPPEQGRKPPRMPLDLLRLLIALGGRGISQERVTELLWPDTEGDQAARNLSVTLARLRKLLGCPHAVTAHDRRLMLDARYCSVDAWAFERGVRESHPDPETAIEALEKALTLYQGPFLNDFEAPWILLMRERLEQRFIEGIGRLGALHEDQSNWAAAAEAYLRGLENAPLLDRFHERLIACLLRLERHGEALEALDRCIRIFKAHELPLPAWHADMQASIHGTGPNP